MQAVCDASVLLKLLVNEADSDKAARLVETISHIAVPDIFFTECANALNRQCRLHYMQVDHARTALSYLNHIGLVVYDSQTIIVRAFSWAAKAHMNRVNDSVYLALAEQLAMPFITADKKFADAVWAVDSSAPIRLLSELSV